MLTSKVWTDDSRLLQELNLTARQPRRAPHYVIQATTSEGLAQGLLMVGRVGFKPATFLTEGTKHHHWATMPSKYKWWWWRWWWWKGAIHLYFHTVALTWSHYPIWLPIVYWCVCVCVLANSGGTVVLVSQDGVQRPPLHFPKGGHLLAFLSCLENGLLPHGRLDPPLWNHKGKGNCFLCEMYGLGEAGELPPVISPRWFPR